MCLASTTRDLLRDLVLTLDVNAKVVVEYGVRYHHGGFYTRCRVRYVRTVHGPQFKLTTFYAGSGEGRAQYYLDNEELLDSAMQIADNHADAVNNNKFDFGTKPNLEWFAYREM